MSFIRVLVLIKGKIESETNINCKNKFWCFSFIEGEYKLGIIYNKCANECSRELHWSAIELPQPATGIKASVLFYTRFNIMLVST